ncbi:tetratricopeptide repeat protein [Bradyrhizobium sp.]|uniref:tetratricopeptide repeat protein n=1 Tax=Bradyrhizobium sp. TaxID=376 RepID=UPI001ECD6EE9|nr:tetratricopeptide repeat protein [Bradyrhizobium sp.]MBV8922823.1 tetratricopeptide repeat protein [Bradyrhizobium sp.]MBV9981636.1 tetratricopeptide repeat protein [Bradyrhizobium sp.]
MSDAGAKAFQRARLQKQQKKAVDGLLSAALEAYNGARFAEAQFICGQVLNVAPDNFDALGLLGLSQLDGSQKEEAEATLRRAVGVDPRSAEAHCNHGVALFELKRYEEACAAYERALSLKPKYLTALNNLGNAWKHLKSLEKAIEFYKRAIALDPRYADAWTNCGTAHLMLSQIEEARLCFAEALRLQPRHVEALVEMARIEVMHRQFAAARSRLDTALTLRPKSPEALVARGSLLVELGDVSAGYRDCEAAVALAPTRTTALVACAEAAKLAGISTRAAELAREALKQIPNDSRALTVLGSCHAAWGDIPGAIARYDEALAASPDDEVAISQKIFALDFLAGADFAVQQEARRVWWTQIGSLVSRCELREIDIDPERRLRIGYVSSDLRQHSAGLAVLPIFQAHDHRQFAIIAYHCSSTNDAVTEQFRACTDQWVDAAEMSDDELATRIKADRVDILVDLSGHTAGNRLAVFCRKPAPLQVSAWGNATGTGVPLIDFLFGDQVAIPEQARPLFAERIADLPCLITIALPDIPVGPSPMLKKGFPTFGVFNRIDKITDEAIAVWARILSAIPDARLVLKHLVLDESHVRTTLLDRFAAAGVALDRVSCLGKSDRPLHLRAFDEIDISLDPFPQNGGVSTWESLYMGVPVITKLGTTTSSRAAASILAAIGLTEFIAPDEEAYVEIARRAVAAPHALAELRAGLPGRIATSEAGDPVRYTRAVESWYRRFWRDYCARASLS